MKLSKWIISRGIKSIALILSVLALSACSHTIFFSYPSQMKSVRQDLRNQQYEAAEKAIQEESNQQDRLLYNAELARVQQIAQQFQASLKAFESVIAKVKQDNLAAKVRVSKFLENTGSLLSNDKAIAYAMPGYAQVFAYQYQALNYFALADNQNALVSIRQAGNQQQFIRQMHEKELAAADKAAREKKVEYKKEKYEEYFAETAKAAGNIKSAFENAFTYYLSSISYESIGDYNNAFVAIKHALGVLPENTVIRQQLIEVLQKRDAHSGQLSDFQRKFGLKRIEPLPEDKAKLVVLYEQGLVPERDSVDIPLPIPMGDGNWQTQIVAIPSYAPVDKDIPHMHVSSGAGFSGGNTLVMVDVGQLAAKALLDEYPIIITRAILRLAAKVAMTAAANKQDAALGLVAQLWSLATSSADKRAWSTLPRTIQAWQSWLPYGKHTISLNTGGRQKKVTVNMSAQTITVLWVIQVGQAFQTKVLSL